MIDERPDTATANPVTPGALKRVEDHDRDERVLLEKRIDREITTLRDEYKAEVGALRNEYKAEVIGLRELYEQAAKFLAEALQLQTGANAEHFKMLNNSEQRAMAEQARTVPLLAFEEFKKTQATALDALAKETQHRLEALAIEEQQYRKRIDDRLAASDVDRAAISARAGGGKEAKTDIKNWIIFAVLIVGFILGTVLPVLNKR